MYLAIRLHFQSPNYDFVKYNGEKGSKESGKMRPEGKDYKVQDGDIFHFRFNV